MNTPQTQHCPLSIERKAIDYAWDYGTARHTPLNGSGDMAADQTCSRAIDDLTLSSASAIICPTLSSLPAEMVATFCARK